jgi:hypothetical protein
MKRILMPVATCVVAFGFWSPAAAERDLRNFGELAFGFAIPDHAEFQENYRQRFCGTLGYGTRLGHNRHFLAYGMLGYNGFRAEKQGLDDTYLGNFNADARWYFGAPAREISGYFGLGPGVYWDKEGDLSIGANVAVGGDFPVGSDWAVTVDIDQHFVDSADKRAFLTVRVGAGYWFL